METANRRAAHAAFVWVVVFIAWHGVWALTGQAVPEPSDHEGAARVAMYVVTPIVYGMTVAGALLPLALTQPWGRRFPRWMLSWAVWTGCLLLTARGVSGLGDAILRATDVLPNGLSGLTAEQIVGHENPTAFDYFMSVATDVIFTAGGLIFYRAARAYQRLGRAERVEAVGRRRFA